MTFDDYRKIEAINASSLKAILRSPAYYLWRMQQEDYDSDAMRLGRAVHAAVLEPEAFRAEFATFPGTRRGKAWDEFKASHDPRSILTETQHDKAVRIAAAVRAHPTAARWLAKGKAEQTITWTDARTGRECKARLDWIGSCVLDLKTCADPDPFAFARTCVTYRYPLQMAFYYDGARAALGFDGPVKILAVGSAEPHEVVPYDVPEAFLDLGRYQYRQAMDTLIECEKSNRWPGLCDTEMCLSLPEWAYDGGGDLGLTMDGEAVVL